MWIVNRYRRIFNRGRATILYYHRFSSIENENGWATPFEKGVSQSDFEKQMKYLRRWYRVVPLEQLVKIIKNNKSLSGDTIAITIDDGYRDNFIYAYPVLRKYGMPATIFLITDYVGTSKNIWWDYLSEILKALHRTKFKLSNLDSLILSNTLKEKLRLFFLTSNQSQLGVLLQQIFNEIKKMSPQRRDKLIQFFSENCSDQSLKTDTHRFLNWDQVLQMRQDGLSFGAHTHTHPNLTTMDISSIKHEITKSKAIIEKQLGSPVKLFAYPSGDFDNKVKEVVKNLGFIAACSTKQGRVDKNSDLFELQRFGVCDETFKGLFGKFSKSLFYLKMSGLFDRCFL